MSLVAVLSDIHGNLAALDEVLADADAQGATQTWCLGDTVGYGADPGRCVRVMMAREAVCVLGNHDAAAVGRDDARWFHLEAQLGVRFAERDLDEACWDFLARLPDRHEPGHRCMMVHGAPDNRSRYLTTNAEFAAEAALMRAAGRVDVCFFGHTHFPVVASASRVWRGDEGVFNLGSGGPYLVNPGSVGQPRDGDPRSSYVLWDTEARWVRFRRLDYDMARSQKRIAEVGLPGGLAGRLGVGR